MYILCKEIKKKFIESTAMKNQKKQRQYKKNTDQKKSMTKINDQKTSVTEINDQKTSVTKTKKKIIISKAKEQ